MAAASLLLGGCAAPVRYGDDFRQGLEQWHIESEKPGRIVVIDGALDIDVPAGCTVWFKSKLRAPVRIEFDATAIARAGANDHVSDLNVFWMATNRDGSAPFTTPRSGRFAEYNDLLTYYVGLGGNRNTTSRFRRYIGHAERRPLRPEHDLSSPDALLVPNQKQTITLIADRNTIEYRRDGRTLFRLDDPEPYTSGWFALRTTQSHLRIERLRIRGQ